MTLYLCSSCGAGSASWMGRCSACGEFNTFQIQEEISKKGKKRSIAPITVTSLASVASLEKKRTKTGLFELDRVLGGGLIPGAVILLTGEPGVGKSTLLLQSLNRLKTLFISGEETPEQIRHRADRLRIDLNNCLFSSDLQVESITRSLKDWVKRVDCVVVDSIQTIYSADIDAPAGSITQLRETASQLITAAKHHNIPVIIVGHVTKGGDIAGPKTLEHMVDTVLQFEGERVSQFRILRALKNRFGSTDEIGVFEMGAQGLKEVTNPVAFLENSTSMVAGRAIVGVAEGSRPLFFEIQALASPTTLSIPRRVVRGLDYNKILLLIAVMKKHLHLPLESYDIYLNVIGGVTVKSPAADLGIIAALYSSIKEMSLGSRVFMGEVGLLGEVRSTFQEKRVIAEAKRLHFSHIFSSANTPAITTLKTIFTPKQKRA